MSVAIPPPGSIGPSPRARLILLAALAGGSSATLAAEVVLERLTAIAFGRSPGAGISALAAFLGGLSLGALASARWWSRHRRPAVLCAALAVASALSYALMPNTYAALCRITSSVSAALIDWPGLFAPLRFVLIFLFALLPTAAAGATLPLLGDLPLWPNGQRRPLSLWAVLSVGGALGVAAASYVLLPTLGLDGTMALASLANVIVAVAIFRAASVPPHASEIPPTTSAGSAPASMSALAMVQGGLALVLATTWTHLMNTVIGDTVHTRPLLKATVLLGIAAGCLAARHLGDRYKLPAISLFILAELGVAMAIGVALPFWDRFPQLVNLSLAIKPEWPFLQREIVRFLFLAVLLLPTCAGLGLSSAALVSALDEGRRRAAGARALVLLCAGGTLGAALAGFALLGHVSSHTILVGAACTALVVAVIAGAGRTSGARPRGETAFAAAAAVSLLFAFIPWNEARLTAGRHAAWDVRSTPAAPIYFKEDPHAGVVTVQRDGTGVLVVKTNGEYRTSSSAVGEFQDMFALLGAFYARDYERAFAGGPGFGRTVPLLYSTSFAGIDLPEPARAMLEANALSLPAFATVLPEEDRVALLMGDERSLLQASRERYGLILAGKSNLTEEGSSDEYSREFFETVRSRLGPNGVLVLWLPFRHMREGAVKTTFATARSVFPHMHLYAPSPAQGFLVASWAPLVVDPATLWRLSSPGRAWPVRQSLHALGLGSFTGLAAYSVFTTDDEWTRYLGAIPRRGRSDLDPPFEYAAAAALAEPPTGLDLARHSTRQLPEFVPPLSPADAAGLLGLRLVVAGDSASAQAPLDAAARLGEPHWLEDAAAVSRLRAQLKPSS